MVISNLNMKLIEDRLGFINESIAKLKRLSYLKQEDFLAEDRPAVAESYSSLSIRLASLIRDVVFVFLFTKRRPSS